MPVAGNDNGPRNGYRYGVIRSPIPDTRLPREYWLPVQVPVAGNDKRFGESGIGGGLKRSPIPVTRFPVTGTVTVIGTGTRTASVRGVPGQVLAEDQSMDVVCAFIGVDGFQVGHVPHGRVFDQNAIRAQQPARLTRNIARHLAVGALGQ